MIQLIFRIYIFIYTFVLHLKLTQDAFRTYCPSSAVSIKLVGSGSFHLISSN